MKLKRKLNFETFKKKKAPNRNDEVDLRSRKRAAKLYREVLLNTNRCILMDDETYVKTDNRQLPGQEFYSQIKGYSVNNKFKFVKVDKFAKKFLVWQAICSCGLRTSTFITSGTMKSENYQKECLQKRLLPLYKQHTVPPIFWPDLASCHYSAINRNWYEVNEVDYVRIPQNPPNSPEIRPIEKYWAIIKRIFKKTSSPSSNITSFKNKWNSASKKYSQDDVQRLMSGLKQKVRRFSEANTL